MGHRLSKIYTRTGDRGETGLGDGSRVPKYHPRVEAYGVVDELNSQLGLVLVEGVGSPLKQWLIAVQHDLFELGGELCIPGRAVLGAGDTERLETWLDRLNAELPPLKEFILPGGVRDSAACHVARTVCRRAERCVAALGDSESINPHSLGYLNRLSDLLFVAARWCNRQAGVEDVLWQPGRSR